MGLFLFSLVLSLGQTIVAADQVVVFTSYPRRVIGSKDHFICATIDYWPSDKYSPNPDAHYPWLNSSVFSADFTNPTLRSAIEALAPMNLRVGGSLADQIIYNITATDSADCAPPQPDKAGDFGYTQGCLSGSRYAELHSLCAETGCGIVFGLNGLYGRIRAPETEALWTGPWDPSNAQDLLVFTKNSGLAENLVGVELGNEIDGAAGLAAKLSPQDYAFAFAQLSSLLAEVWPDTDADSQRPFLVGPDSSGFSDSWWYPQFLGNLSSFGVQLDAVTWHLYFLGSGNSSAVPEEILNATYLNSLAPKCQSHHATLQTYTGDGEVPQFWLGEGGGAYNSGQDGSTNTFLSTFWFVDNLGTLAATGHDSFCRQALIGGNYALLQSSPSSSALTPNPDFYAALLWRTIMGDVVLSTFARQVDGDLDDQLWSLGGNGTQGDLRAYSHCARPGAISDLPAGSVSVVLINLSENSRDVDLNVAMELPQGNKSHASHTEANTESFRYEWHLTSTSLDSYSTYLNDAILELDENGELNLPLQPISVPSSSKVVLSPHSTAFVLLPLAEAPACQESS